ncbi:MAG: coproporphyrinogen III oxidase, partial [Gammaproteobacteria bacterium]|nr:coproporphyrinogen III oxidase [Gammaproteobacteria bacterium]
MSETAFDIDLIERYGGRGPRYTSYPTAVQFRPDFGERDYRAEVRRSDGVSPHAPLSIYVHIPFCHSLCYYCGCSKIVTRHTERAEDYLGLL